MNNNLCCSCGKNVGESNMNRHLNNCKRYLDYREQKLKEYYTNKYGKYGYKTYLKMLDTMKTCKWNKVIWETLTIYSDTDTPTDILNMLKGKVFGAHDDSLENLEEALYLIKIKYHHDDSLENLKDNLGVVF